MGGVLAQEGHTREAPRAPVKQSPHKLPPEYRSHGHISPEPRPLTGRLPGEPLGEDIAVSRGCGRRRDPRRPHMSHPVVSVMLSHVHLSRPGPLACESTRPVMKQHSQHHSAAAVDFVPSGAFGFPAQDVLTFGLQNFTIRCESVTNLFYLRIFGSEPIQAFQCLSGGVKTRPDSQIIDSRSMADSPRTCGILVQRRE